MKDPPHRVRPKNGDVCVVYEASSAAEDDTIRCLSSAASVGVLLYVIQAVAIVLL